MKKTTKKEKQSYCTIYLVRHGETEWNVKGLLQGHSDSVLTKTGERQAQELADKLRQIHFDAVFSSDSLRAKRTAEIMMLEKNIAVQTTKLIRERRFGRFEGKSYAVFNAQLKTLVDKYERLNEAERFRYKSHQDVESDEELISRVITFFREMAVGNIGKKVLVVSHGGVLRVLLIHLGYGSYSELPPGCVKNLAYIKLDCDGVDFFIREVSGVEKKPGSSPAIR